MPCLSRSQGNSPAVREKRSRSIRRGRCAGGGRTICGRFVASPSASHAGTTMPDLLTIETDDQRTKIADAITHYLVAQSRRKFRREAVGDKEASEGKALFHTIGCVACHSPRDENGKETTRAGIVALEHVPVKYSLSSLVEFLFQPAGGVLASSGRNAGHEVDAGRGQRGCQLPARQGRRDGQRRLNHVMSLWPLVRSIFSSSIARHVTNSATSPPRPWSVTCRTRTWSVVAWPRRRARVRASISMATK